MGTRNVGKSRKLLAGLAALTLFDISASVAAPPAPPTPDWSGFYVGAHAGYRWAGPTFSGNPYEFDPGTGVPIMFPGRSENYSLNGGIFGGQAGYNYLLGRSWLLGIEGDISYGSQSSSQSSSLTVIDVTSDGYTLTGISTIKLSWQATLRGRLGYTYGPWMYYGTAGVAFMHVKWSDSSSISEICCISLPVDPTTAGSSGEKTLTGSVVGVGIEYMFDPNWIGRLEYLYENFGNFAVPFGFGPQIGTLHIGEVQKLRFGISYKFGH